MIRNELFQQLRSRLKRQRRLFIAINLCRPKKNVVSVHGSPLCPCRGDHLAVRVHLSNECKYIENAGEIREIQAQNSALKQEVEKLQSPDRMKEEAVRLGFNLDDDKKVSLVTPAKP